jgi:hypothetical protein
MTWLTATEYLCHKWPRICSSCHKHFPVLSSCMTYHRVCNSSSAPVVSGVRVTRSLVLCAMFCRSFGHCVVGSSPIYGFWLPLWYLQTLLPSISLLFCRFYEIFSFQRNKRLVIQTNLIRKLRKIWARLL